MRPCSDVFGGFRITSYNVCYTKLLRWAGEGDADAVIEKRGLKQITDTSAIEQAIQAVLDANPGQVAEYRAGKEKLFGFFVGQVMKATRGQANPQVVTEILQRKLAGG